MTKAPDAKDSEWSSLREQYIEYAFLGELCKELWRRDLPVDILRAHTDQSGFDIVLEAGVMQRHVQLKSSFVGAATQGQNVNKKLEEKVGGCIIWIVFSRDNFELHHYLWFGDSDPTAVMRSLGDRQVKHTKANAQGFKAIRPGIRRLGKSSFTKVGDIGELASLLFPYQIVEEQVGERIVA